MTTPPNWYLNRRGWSPSRLHHRHCLSGYAPRTRAALDAFVALAPEPGRPRSDAYRLARRRVRLELVRDGERRRLRKHLAAIELARSRSFGATVRRALGRALAEVRRRLALFA
jgi:hypothetical protein